MAELTDARKAALMAYCKIDEFGPGEEELLHCMFSDAVEYMAGAGVKIPANGSDLSAQYDMLINAMVLDAWDNRGSQIAGVTMAENPAFRRKINQIKRKQPVSILGTGSSGSEAGYS